MNTPTKPTFHAHGEDWFPHIPGDPMLCDGESKPTVLFADGGTSLGATMAKHWLWDDAHEGSNIIGWRYETPPATPQPQEPDELATLRIKLEDAETVMEDIASDIAEFAADGDSPNAGPRDRLAVKVFSHISAHRASAPDSKLSWKDKQIAGLEESLRAAKERMLTNDAELATLRAERELTLAAIREASLLPERWRNVDSPSVIYSRCAQDLESVLHLFQPIPSK